MRQLNDTIIATKAAANTNSDAINTENIFQMSVQMVAVGAVAGTMKLQATNDNPTRGTAVPTNWVDITGATVAVSGAGSVMIPKTEICYQYVRIVYTDTGAAGTITVIIKALGA